MKINGQTFTKKAFEDYLRTQANVMEIVYVEDQVDVARHMCLTTGKMVALKREMLNFTSDEGEQLEVDNWFCGGCRKVVVYQAALPFG